MIARGNGGRTDQTLHVTQTLPPRQAWPRGSAVAERLWSAESVTNLTDASWRLSYHRCRLVSRGIMASPMEGSVGWLDRFVFGRVLTQRLCCEQLATALTCFHKLRMVAQSSSSCFNQYPAFVCSCCCSCCCCVCGCCACSSSSSHCSTWKGPMEPTALMLDREWLCSVRYLCWVVPWMAPLACSGQPHLPALLQSLPAPAALPRHPLLSSWRPVAHPFAVGGCK